jgi:predicted alpha/beta hydrolase
MMFENRVQTKIMGPKSDEVAREWRRLHKQKIYKFYSDDQIRKNKISGSCSM